MLPHWATELAKLSTPLQLAAYFLSPTAPGQHQTQRQRNKPRTRHQLPYSSLLVHLRRLLPATASGPDPILDAPKQCRGRPLCPRATQRSLL